MSGNRTKSYSLKIFESSITELIIMKASSVYFILAGWVLNSSDPVPNFRCIFTCMRRIIKIRWPYVISNEDLMKRTEAKRVSTEVKTRRWKWIGHVLRMERNSHCRTALTWQPEGERRRGRPRTTWRRTVEHEGKEMGNCIMGNNKKHGNG